jgi:fructokinase
MRIGIDLGGTKIEGMVLAPDGSVPFRERRPTPRNDYDGTIEVIAGLIEAAEHATARPCTVGIGMPGTISPATGLVKNANSTWLNGRRLHEDIEGRLHRPVRLANDANCFALSEASDGAAAGASVVFGVILGTGCGGGLVVHGRVVTGPNAIAGEWGHNPLPWPDDTERPGPPCYCGKRGCLETFISGPGFARDYAARAGVGDSGLDAAMIVSRAAQGDLEAAAALDRYMSRVARGLATIVNVLDPDVIVLGGGMSNVAHLYEEVPRRLPPFVFSDRVVTTIVPPRHGDSSGVRGAAWLWSLEEARAVTAAAPGPRAGGGAAGV